MNNTSKFILKPFVEYCSLDGKIYFFNRPGVATTLDDPSSFITNVCKLMRYGITFDELYENLLPLFPNEVPFLEKLLSILDHEYLLEDVSFNYPKDLKEHDINRLSRNIEFFGSYCKAKENKFSYQEKLHSTILYNLVALGVRNIKCIDFDKIELSNLNRQIIYNEADVGKLKTEVAKERICNFMTNAHFEFINKKITSCEDIENIICDRDIVIVAIDNPREKIIDWFNLACVKKQIPFLCGSLDNRLVTYYTIIPGKTGCIECWKNSKGTSSLIFQNFIQSEGFVSALSPNVAIMPFISLLSGFVSKEFLNIVTGINCPQSLGRLCGYDFVSSELKILESWELNPACSICSMN
jgi:molybdopterin-synthase adenylyltransferase